MIRCFSLSAPSFLRFLVSSFFSFFFFSVGDDLDRSNSTTRLLGRSNIKRVDMRTIPIDNQSQYHHKTKCIMTKRSTILTFCSFLFLSLLGDPDQSSTRSNTERVEATPADNRSCVSRANVARPILVNPYLDTINRVARNSSSIDNRIDNSNYSLISF